MPGHSFYLHVISCKSALSQNHIEALIFHYIKNIYINISIKQHMILGSAMHNIVQSACTAVEILLNTPYILFINALQHKC